MGGPGGTPHGEQLGQRQVLVSFYLGLEQADLVGGPGETPHGE